MSLDLSIFTAASTTPLVSTKVLSVGVATYSLNEAEKNEVIAKFQNLDLYKPQSSGAAERSSEHNQAGIRQSSMLIMPPLFILCQTPGKFLNYFMFWLK